MDKLLPYQQTSKAIGFSVAIMSVPHGQGGAFSNEGGYIYFVFWAALCISPGGLVSIQDAWGWVNKPIELL